MTKVIVSNKEDMEQLSVLEWHLLNNHFPPIPAEFAYIAQAAIKACNTGTPQTIIAFEKELDISGARELTAAEIVDIMRLEFFLNNSDRSMLTLKVEGPNDDTHEILIVFRGDQMVVTINGTTAIFPTYDKNDDGSYNRRGMTPATRAEAIYSMCYTGDDGRHRKAKTSEIEDWLTDGDGGEGRSIAELAREWIEYDIDPEREE